MERDPYRRIYPSARGTWRKDAKRWCTKMNQTGKENKKTRHNERLGKTSMRKERQEITRAEKEDVRKKTDYFLSSCVCVCITRQENVNMMLLSMFLTQWFWWNHSFFAADPWQLATPTALLLHDPHTSIPAASQTRKKRVSQEGTGNPKTFVLLFLSQLLLLLLLLLPLPLAPTLFHRAASSISLSLSLSQRKR